MSQTRFLGHSGLQVSVVGLGTNNFGGHLDLEASRPVIHAALDAGITLFDTADVYGNKGGSEAILGEVLGARRQDIVLATKFGNTFDETRGLRGASRRYILRAVEASLQRLKTDWIDLYQIRRADPNTPIEETVLTLHDLIRSGKVRYIGLSNFAPWQIVEAQLIAKSLGIPPFITSQDEFSLLKPQAAGERADVLRRYGVSLLPYLPLASGLLTGKYHRNAPVPPGTRLDKGGPRAERHLNDANLAKVEILRDYAASQGHSLLELAFSWLVSQDFIGSVIAGATTAEQVQQNVAAANWQLSAADQHAIAEIIGLQKDLVRRG